MLGTSHIFQGDRHAPFFSQDIGHIDLPSGWTRSDVHVQDDGLGVKLLEVS